MSSNVLFDDDSSDEELQDEEQQPKKRVTQAKFDDDDDDDEEAKVKDAPKRTIEIDEADDDDDDDDENVSRDRGPPKTSEKTPTEPKKVVYSPDEEDVEFDDGEGIVGSAAPAKPASDSPPKLRRPKKMTVLNSKRPSADTTLHITKLPNVVGIQPEPFDVDSFKPEDEEAEYNGYVHNMIRWRYQKDKDGNFIRSKDGKLMRESNARLVKWDDGSMTLHVGSEVFICDQRESGPSGYPGLNGYLYLSQKATFPTENDDDNNEEDDEQPGGTVLECMGPIASKLSARPSSLQSAAHKALTVAVRQKTTKRATIAAYVTNEDPEKLKEERIRQKTDLDKAQARKNTTRHYTSGSSTRRTPGMNRRYMEEEDANYDSVNIKDLKRRDRPVDDDVDYASEDDDDDEDVGWSRGRLAAMRDTKKRGRQAMESDDDGEEEFNVGGDDSDDEEQVALKKPKKAQSNMFDDDDD